VLLLAMLGTGVGADVLGHALGLATGAGLGVAAAMSRGRPGAPTQRALIAAGALAVVGAWFLAFTGVPR